MDFFGVIPIAAGQSREALQQINVLLLAGEVVCLFPEGGNIIGRSSCGKLKHGYEHTVKGVDGIILPFYLRGLWGSRFSHSSEKLQEIRDLRLQEGMSSSPSANPCPLTRQPMRLKDRYSNSQMIPRNTIADPRPHSLGVVAQRKTWGNASCLADASATTRLSAYKILIAVIAFSRLIRRRSQEHNIGLLLPTSSMPASSLT